MLRIVSDGLWSEIRKLRRPRGAVSAAIAYVTSDAYLKLRRGDVLVCDASDSAIASGQTSTDVLRAAFARGAKVFSSPGLHAKALVLGRVAVVGSANMSESSASTLDEAAMITDDARAVAGVRALVERLSQGADRVDARFLARIAKIKVRPPRRASRRRRPIKIGSQRAWLINVVPLDDDKHESEHDLVETEKAEAERDTEFEDSAPGYLRWTGTSSFQKFAKAGDVVIAIWCPSSNSKRGRVYSPEPILRRADRKKVTHFIVEEYADREDTALSFTSFTALWRRVGAGRPPSLRSVREIPIDLAETLRHSWGNH